MTEHTKGPLVIGKLGVIKGGPVHHFKNGSGQSQLFMAMAGLEMSHEERDANGEHMVKCWNKHDGLVAQVKALEERLGDTEPKQMRRYFVFYTYWRADGKSTYGVACTELESDEPITGFKQIQEMVDFLKQRDNMELVVINSWQLFEGQS
jgi:hypothetical protein